MSSKRKAKARGLEVQDQLQLQSQFEVSLNTGDPVSRTINKTGTNSNGDEGEMPFLELNSKIASQTQPPLAGSAYLREL